MILSLTLLFAGLLALMYALGQLVTRKVSTEARLMAGIYLALAMMLLHAGALVSGFILEAPYLLGWYLPGLLAIGPLISRFLQMRLKLPGEFSGWLWHLVPATVAIPCLLVYQFQDSTTRYELIVGAQSGNLNPAYLIILAITSLHPITYALLGLVQLVRAIGWRWHRSEQSVRLLGLFLISLGLVSLLLLVGFAFSNGAILFTGAMCAALILPGLYILGRRYPYFFDELQTAVERSRYRNSQLKGKDLSRIERSLKECMVAQEVFKEEDLSLPELAACVQLSPHQLSEYFNVHLNLNFSRFINQYRIREACKMLVEHPDMTVLNIAFSVGFNSKSVFNAAFLRETGLTPTTYRSKNVVRQG